MIQKPFFERHFWRLAVVLFVTIVTINYFPAIAGKVPFPRDIVLRHSAWEGQPRSGSPQQVGQLIDIVAMFYPFRALAGSSVHSGVVPLWNPYIMSGAPFQANAQSAVFGPLNLLYYLLPLKAAWTANLALRMFLAGIFMTLFARAIGATRTGAIVSGVVFALCGFTVQWQGESNGESGIWLPLMCYSIHRLHQRADRRSVAIAGFAFAAPLLAGHPETAAHSTAFAAAMALMLWLQRDSPRFLRMFVLAGLLSIGLTAVQIIPTLEWMGQLGLKVESAQPVLDRHQGQGFFSRDILRDPSSAGISIPEGSSYVGMLAVLAAPFALFYRPRRYVWFLGGSAVVATMIAFGIPPVQWVVAHLPIVKAMKNGRLILVTDFALAALAALGITVLQQQLALLRTRFRSRSLLLFAGTFLALLFCVYEVHRATWTPVEFWRSPWGSLIFLIAALLVLGGRLAGALNDRAFEGLTCALVAVEMLTFSYGFLGFAPASEVFPPAAPLDFIREQSSAVPFRVAKDRVPIPHDAGMIYGFEAADGYDLTTEKTRMFTADFTENREDGVMFRAEKILAAHDRRLDMLNVKYLMVTAPGPQFTMIANNPDRFQPVFSRGSVAIFENKSVLPRALAVPVSGIEVVPDAAAQLARVKEASFEPAASVVFGERPTQIDARGSNAALPAGRVEVVDRGINDIHLRAELQSPAVIVLSQMYYPGWQATVDGASVQVHPVNVALTGIVVPANAREIHLYFRPLSFRIGAVISLLSLLTIGYALRATGAAQRL